MQTQNLMFHATRTLTLLNSYHIYESIKTERLTMRIYGHATVKYFSAFSYATTSFFSANCFKHAFCLPEVWKSIHSFSEQYLKLMCDQLDLQPLKIKLCICVPWRHVGERRCSSYIPVLGTG